MTPLEKAKAEEGHVNYCDECEHFQIVGNAAYCVRSGKMISPIMLMRWQGTGPAWNCKKRLKPKTKADRIRAMTDEELAELWWERVDCGECPVHRDCKMTGQDCKKLALDWLKQEAKE